MGESVVEEAQSVGIWSGDCRNGRNVVEIAQTKEF